MDIKISNLTKSYGSQRAVDDISFEVKTGEILGFLGPNGAGKTTTMKMIAGMEVTAVDYQQQEQSVQLERTPEGWMQNGAPIDSMEVENYLNALRNLSATEFADGFAPGSQLPLKSLTYSGNNMTTPFHVKVFRNTVADASFVVHFSYRPDTYFSSDSTGIYNGLFGKLDALLAP